MRSFKILEAKEKARGERGNWRGARTIFSTRERARARGPVASRRPEQASGSL